MAGQWMRRWVALIVLAVLLMVIAAPKGTDDLDAHNKQVVTLYRQGNYAEATEITKRLLALAEEKFGPDHPDVGQSLNNLAELYRAQGRYAEVEPLYKRSLVLYEKALGPDPGESAQPRGSSRELPT
jgi:tetratricopeptide (TPR) repeat protein